MIWNASNKPLDFDLDRIPDEIDDDDDNDGYLDREDKYPKDPTKWKREEEEEGFIPSFETSILLIIILLLIIIKRKK